MDRTKKWLIRVIPVAIVAVATHVVAFTVLSNPASAQGLGCGWCFHWNYGGDWHIFAGGADGCGWPPATSPQ